MLTNKLDDSGRKMSNPGWQEEVAGSERPWRTECRSCRQLCQQLWITPGCPDSPSIPSAGRSCSGIAWSPPAPPVGGKTLSQPSHMCVARDLWETLA